MDNSNTQSSPQAPVPPPSNPAPAGINPVMTDPAPSSGGKNMMWVIIGLVVILLLGGVYWYLNIRQVNPKISVQTTGQAKPTTTSADSLEQQINTMDISDSDSDFTGVDADIKSL